MRKRRRTPAPECTCATRAMRRFRSTGTACWSGLSCSVATSDRSIARAGEREESVTGLRPLAVASERLYLDEAGAREQLGELILRVPVEEEDAVFLVLDTSAGDQLIAEQSLVGLLALVDVEQSRQAADGGSIG